MEERSGDDLYQFVHLHRPASARLRGWAFFFAVKLWWAQRRAELLKWGDLVPVLRSIRETEDVPASIRVAQIRGAKWIYASSDGIRIGDPPHIVFVIRGVVFIVTRAPKNTLFPWPSVELEKGTTRADLPRLNVSHMRALLAP